MKTIATSILALGLSTSVLMAESHTMNMDSEAQLIRSRDITGGAVYTLNEADDEGWDADWTYNDVRDRVNEIGEIEDIVLNSDGELVGIVAEVGGFLDIGDKHVMLKINDMKLTPVDDKQYVVITRFNEEELEAMEGVDEGFWN
jgi:hypothetical protein